MERQNFEKGFQDAFRDAESSPSENTWVNIELELERAEGKKMRRRIIFYKLLAAASVTFALAFAGLGTLIYRNQQNVNSLAEHATPGGSGKQENSNADGSTVRQNSIDGKDTRMDAAIADVGDTADADRTEANRNIATREEATGKPGVNPEQHGRNNIVRSDASNSTNNDKRELANSGVADANRSTQSGNTAAAPVNNDERRLADGGKDYPGPDNAKKSTLDATVAINDNKAKETFQRDERDHTIASNNGDAELNKTEALNTAGGKAAPDKILSRDEKVVAQDSKKQNSRTDAEAVSSEPDPVALMALQLMDREKELAALATGKKKKASEEREDLWTSVGFAAGGYNGRQASAGGATQMNSFASTSTLDNQAKASGTSYSFNISMGKRITERLVLQGGLSYVNNSTSYTSNQVVLGENNSFKAATFKDVRAAESSLLDNNSVIPTAPHSVNNSLEFISLPVQAGYVIVDRRFGVQFNAGVSTDFFIQNTIDPEGSDLKKTTQDRGAESPYRSTNFSGLMGTELTYRLGQNYRLSLNPGIRYPFNSIFKDETGIDSTPLTFDVGLRFRYIFR